MLHPPRRPDSHPHLTFRCGVTRKNTKTQEQRQDLQDLRALVEQDQQALYVSSF